MAKRVLEHPKIKPMWNTVIEGYEGQDKLERVKLRNIVTGEASVVPVGGLFMAIGHVPLTKGLEKTGLELDAEGYVKVKHDQVYTSIDGVFTCGDVHDTIFRQAVTAAGFGCMAAITAERWLDAKEASK